MVKRNICVVTGSRADFGLYRWIMAELRDSGLFEVELAVTGMHLAAGFGASLAEVEQSGFPIAWRIDTLLGSDGSVGMTKSVGLGVLGFADAFSHRRPDLVLALGDRFEMLAAVQAAFLLRIPIAHIGGGDLTEGALDDGIRHAITKMSGLHLVTNDDAAKRLARMGEKPERIHVVGSPGIDAIHRLELLPPEEVFQRIGLTRRRNLLVVTFHPATADARPSGEQFRELLAALDMQGPDTAILMTMPNADAEGRGLGEMAQNFANSRDTVAVRQSLGQLLYLSAVAAADAVVGNSSSGLYEAPPLSVPTVNIGSRQDGRLRTASVVDCPPERQAIADAIARALPMKGMAVDSPYGKGDTAQRICAILMACRDFNGLLEKPFHDGE